MISTKLTSFIGLVGAMVTMSMGSAFANMTPTFDIPPINNGSDYTFNYHVTLDAQQFVLTDDYTSLSGIAGYVPDSAIAPTDWNPIVTESDGLTNIQYVYVGTDQVGGAGSAVELGEFSFKSVYGQYQVNLDYFSAAHKYEYGNTTETFNGGHVFGPMVPEPGSLALVLPGLVPLGIIFRRKRSS